MGVSCNKGELPASPSRLDTAAPPSRHPVTKGARNLTPISEESAGESVELGGERTVSRENNTSERSSEELGAASEAVGEAIDESAQAGGESATRNELQAVNSEAVTREAPRIALGEVVVISEVSEMNSSVSAVNSEVSEVNTETLAGVRGGLATITEQSSSSSSQTEGGGGENSKVRQEEMLTSHAVIPDSLERAHLDVSPPKHYQQNERENDSDNEERDSNEHRSSSDSEDTLQENNSSEDGETGSKQENEDRERENDDTEQDNNANSDEGDAEGKHENEAEREEDNNTPKEGDSTLWKNNKQALGENEDDEYVEETEEEERTEKDESPGVEWVMKMEDRDKMTRSLEALYLVLEIRSTVPIMHRHIDLTRAHLHRWWWWWSLGVRRRTRAGDMWICVLPPPVVDQSKDDDDHKSNDDDDDDYDDDDFSDGDYSSESESAWLEVAEQLERQRRSRTGGPLCFLTHLASQILPPGSPTQTTGPATPNPCTTNNTSNPCTDDSPNPCIIDTARPQNTNNSTSDEDRPDVTARHVDNASGSSGIESQHACDGPPDQNSWATSSSVTAVITPADPTTATANTSICEGAVGGCSDKTDSVSESWRYRTFLILSFPRVFLDGLSPKTFCESIVAQLDRVTGQKGTTKDHRQRVRSQEVNREDQNQGSLDQEQTEEEQRQRVRDQEQTEDEEKQKVRGQEQTEELRLSLRDQEQTDGPRWRVRGQEQRQRLRGEEQTGEEEQRQRVRNEGPRQTDEGAAGIEEQRLTWLQERLAHLMGVDQDVNTTTTDHNNDTDSEGYHQRTLDSVLSRNFINLCKAKRISYVSGFTTCVSIATASLVEAMSETGHSGRLVTRQRVWVRREWPAPPYGWRESHDGRPRHRQPHKRPDIILCCPARKNVTDFWEAAIEVHRQRWETPAVSWTGSPELIHWAQPSDDSEDYFRPPRFPYAELRLVGVTREGSEEMAVRWTGQRLMHMATHTLTPLRRFLFTHIINLQVQEDSHVISFSISYSRLVPPTITRCFADEILATVKDSLTAR